MTTRQNRKNQKPISKNICMSDGRPKLTRDLVWIFALGLLFRLALLLLFPVPYGNDAVGRLYFRDSIFTWHWLPVTQALVYLPFAATQSVFVVRMIFAISGSLAAVAFTFYLQTFASRRAAIIGGTLFAINAHAVFLSLMPYQEIVFLGLLFGSLAFFLHAQNARYHFIIGSALYGLACLTRYEAWFILPTLFLAGIRPLLRSGRVLISAIKNLIGLGWGPALWLLINWLQWGSPTAFLFHRADHAFYAWSPHNEIARIVDYIGNMLYWLLRFGSPLILFALPGIWVFWKNRKTLFPTLWPALLLLLLVSLFLIFVAGKEFATANRFVMVPLGILLVFTALGIDDFLDRASQASHRLLQKLTQPTAQKMIAVSLLVFLLFYGAMPVMQANQLAVHREPYEIATFLKANLSRNESALIVAASREGEVPMFYQRVFGQLEFDKEQLFCSYFLTPDEIDSIESWSVARRLRYVVVCNEQSSNAVFTRIVAAARAQMKVAFSNNAATIYNNIK
jgi:hypothetical protein